MGRSQLSGSELSSGGTTVVSTAGEKASQPSEEQGQRAQAGASAVGLCGDVSEQDVSCVLASACLHHVCVTTCMDAGGGLMKVPLTK